MTRRGIVPLSVSLVLLTFLIVPLVAGTPAESAFKKLQSLAGQWEGKDAHGMAAKTSAGNLKSPETGHQHHLVLSFEDDNHITETWTWREGGKDTPMVFHFSRKPK